MGRTPKWRKRSRAPAARLLGAGCALLLLAGCARRPGGTAATRESREFHIRYLADVDGIPAGAKELKLWIPCPQGDLHQEIGNVVVRSRHEHWITTDPKYGNRIVYVRVERPPRRVQVELAFDVRRYANDPAVREDTDAAKIPLARRAQELVPLNEETRARAKRAVGRETGGPRQARALYDHVLDHMTYDKSGTGWGRGSYAHACNIGRGNCTDYHAYFIGLSRSIGVPAYFEIGLAVPHGPTEGEVKGYHCWAYFWDGGRWVPVDISEGDKNPAKEGFFFGRHDANRVAFSRGRDIVLEPKQAGEPLNFFIYPYAEVDGQPHDQVGKTTYYRAK